MERSIGGAFCGCRRGPLSSRKSGKRFLGQVCSRLSVSRSLLQGIASTATAGVKIVIAYRRRGAFCKDINCTAARRWPTFVCARRRGLCSISGCYPYGIDNPPTLRRSSFPQRALRPAGGPIPKHTWGCAPRPPNSQAAAGYERCKHRPYGAADTLSRCLRRILFWILQGPN